MWSQLYGVCYCLSNSCAVVFKHNRRFNYRPQFQDRQKPLFHLAQYGDDIIGREFNLRKLPGRQWESCPQPYEQLRLITIKTNASTESATAAYIARPATKKLARHYGKLKWRHMQFHDNEILSRSCPHRYWHSGAYMGDDSPWRKFRWTRSSSTRHLLAISRWHVVDHMDDDEYLKSADFVVNTWDCCAIRVS